MYCDDTTVSNYLEWKASDRIQLLERAIKTHLVELGFKDDDDTIEWWIESMQPAKAVTKK